MTVRTLDLALVDLVEDALPVAVRQRRTDVEALIAEMVELEHEGIGLPTDATRMMREEREEIAGSRQGLRLFALTCLVDVPLAVGDIVALFVCGATRPAEAVALVPVLTAPGEVLHGLGRPTVPAAPASRTLHYEHMFASDADGTVVDSTGSRGVAQSGSAPGWGPGGRRFKSCLPDSLHKAPA